MKNKVRELKGCLGKSKDGKVWASSFECMMLL